MRNKNLPPWIPKKISVHFLHFGITSPPGFYSEVLWLIQWIHSMNSFNGSHSMNQFNESIQWIHLIILIYLRPPNLKTYPKTQNIYQKHMWKYRFSWTLGDCSQVCCWLVSNSLIGVHIGRHPYWPTSNICNGSRLCNGFRLRKEVLQRQTVT